MPSVRTRTLRLSMVLALVLLFASCSRINPVTAVLAPGLFALSVLNNLEGLLYFGALTGAFDPEDVEVFGPLDGDFLVAIAGSEGYVVIDLLSNEIVYQELSSQAGPMFGVIGLSREPLGTSSPAALIGFGGLGKNVAQYSLGNTAFSTSKDYLGGATYDAYPAGNSLSADLVPYVRPSLGVGFLYYDSAESKYRQSQEVLPAAGFTGELVSAFLADDDLMTNQPILVLDRAVSSSLYLDYRDGSGPTYLRSMGLDARKLRCIDTHSASGYLCAASVFGQDQIAMFNWDGMSTASMPNFYPVGDGPVGIDLAPMSDGSYAVLSTGFNDNTVTELKISADTNLLDSLSQATPSGCFGTGHAAYVEDAVGHNVVGTCYTSGNYYVLKAGLAF